MDPYITKISQIMTKKGRYMTKMCPKSRTVRQFQIKFNNGKSQYACYHNMSGSKYTINISFQIQAKVSYDPYVHSCWALDSNWRLCIKDITDKLSVWSPCSYSQVVWILVTLNAHIQNWLWYPSFAPSYNFEHSVEC